MKIALWIAQIFVGLAFVLIGGMMLLQSKSDIIANGLVVIVDFDPSLIKFIGLLEILGGIGIILPHRTKMMPILTPLASIGLIILMLGALITHFVNNDVSGIAPALFLGSLTCFILWQTLDLLAQK